MHLFRTFASPFMRRRGVSVARKNLLAEKTRLFISVGGVGFAVLLILVLQGLYQGWDRKMGTYIERSGADIWVSRRGADDMFHSMSLLPRDLGNRIEEIEGVGEVHPLQSRRYPLLVDGEEALTVIVGYHPESGIGGPLEILEGNNVPGPEEIIIDRAYSDRYGIGIGDTLLMGEEPLRVVGISEGADFLMYQYSFISASEGERLLQLGNSVNYFLVNVEDPKQVSGVIDRIEDRFPGVEALARDEFAETSRQILTDYFIPILGVLLAIGFTIGVAVIGLTTYTATVEKSREYGILKAIGARNDQLYRILLEQGLIVGTLGFGLGAALALLVNQLAWRVVPEFVTSIMPLDLAWVMGASLLMGLVASYLPVRRLAGIDPALVFKS